MSPCIYETFAYACLLFINLFVFTGYSGILQSLAYSVVTCTCAGKPIILTLLWHELPVLGEKKCGGKTFFTENCLSLSQVSVLQWGTVNVQGKLPSAENPERSEVPSFKSWVGQNIHLHALPAARNCEFLPSQFIELHFVPSPLQTQSGACCKWLVRLLLVIGWVLCHLDLSTVD